MFRDNTENDNRRPDKGETEERKETRIDGREAIARGTRQF